MLNFKKQPWLKKVSPLWLREKIYHRFYSKNRCRFEELYDDAVLEFAPQVKLKLLPTDISHEMIALCGFYELPVTRNIVNIARSGGLMVDVGANYGYYSCLWAALGKNNRVIAFEASPRNFGPLSNNVSRNKFDSRIELNMKAVGYYSGNSYFNLGPDRQSGWGGLSINNEENCIEIPIVTLDDFFHNINDTYIDVLKIDTEGADAYVLKGAEQLLRARRIRHIFFEENSVRMEKLSIKPGTSQNTLKEFGYTVRRLAVSEWYAESASLR